MTRVAAIDCGTNSIRLLVAELDHRARRLYWLNPEPRAEWDTLDSRVGEYAVHCTEAFEVSTIRQLTAAVTQIV
jgi:uncharacterized protein with von Willebrand factor type A (vWA) domain